MQITYYNYAITNNTITNEYDIANSLNNYFVNIANSMAKDIPITNDYRKYLGESNSNSVFLQPTDPT